MAQGQRVRIGEVYVSEASREQGSVRLYAHQVRTIESESNVIVLDAPTGSGKTLAALARVVERQSPAVFIYPTNALVKDQVDKMADLLRDLGYIPNVIDEKWEASSVEEVSGEKAVDLIHATGDTLEKLAGEGAKGTVLERILTGTDRKDRMRIILTNPDTLYLVNSGMYHRHGLISDQLFKFRSIVVDEFHLHSGPALARLFFMLNEMRNTSEPPAELVFLSATHGDTLQLLQSTYPELDIVHVTPLTESAPGRKLVRHKTQGEVRAQSIVLTDDESAEQIAHEIIKLYDSPHKWQEGTPRVKVLAIFSSVTFAVSLATRVKALLSERGVDAEAIVKQSHGLVPRSARPDIAKLSEAILIGTSAIEVGVDFDVPFLVMEAHDLASFLQRFGRGGRHGPCEFLLYIPQTMTLRLSKFEDWTFPDFVREAEEAFKELPSYADFLCSRYARTMLLAMALAGSKTYDTYRKKEEYDLKAARAYFRDLVKANQNVSMGQGRLVDSIGSLEDDIIGTDLGRFPVEVMAKHSLARGSMNTVLVLYPGRLVGSSDPHVVAEIDIFDVFRLTGFLDSAANHWSAIPRSLQRRYDKDSCIFVADGFGKRAWPGASLDPAAWARHGTAVFMKNQTTVRTGNPHMTEVLNGILEKRNLVFFWRGLNKGTDYRIPRLYAENESGGLVVGDWALVAEYLSYRQREEDRRL